MRGTVDVEKGADDGPLRTPQLAGVVGQNKQTNKQARPERIVSLKPREGALDAARIPTAW